MSDLSRFHFLKNRPFLAIRVYVQPTGNAKTERAGWLDDHDNYKLTEEPILTHRVSDKLLRECAIIIDILNDKVIKNRLRMTSSSISPELLDNQVLKHFKEKHADIFTQAKNVGSVA